MDHRPPVCLFRGSTPCSDIVTNARSAAGGDPSAIMTLNTRAAAFLTGRPAGTAALSAYRSRSTAIFAPPHCPRLSSRKACRANARSFDMSPHARIPAAVFDLLPDIGQSGFLVYAALALHAGPSGTCWPSQRTLSARTGLQKRAIQLALAKLTAAGLVESKRTGRTNRYRLAANLLGESQPAKGAPNCASEAHGDAPSGAPGCASDAHGGAPLRNNGKNNTKNRPAAAAGAAGQPPAAKTISAAEAARQKREALRAAIVRQTGIRDEKRIQAILRRQTG